MGEMITKYETLMDEPILLDVWTRAMYKELSCLLHGYTNEKGTSTIHFMSIDDIQQIPRDHTIMYTRIMVDYCAQNKDENLVCIFMSGNLMNNSGKETTQTADSTT